MEASKNTRKNARALNVTLDAGVWGKLQDYIPLQNVYEKLPHQDLFRLRLVCKAWNHAALQRLEPEPYFVTIALGCDDKYLNGILTYDAATEKFSYKRQRFPIRHDSSINAPFEVEGLIFCNHPYNLHQQGVFNVHTKIWHAIPPAPEHSNSGSAYGMMVDTSERPYSFKLVVGSTDKKTQIYDSQSRSWSTTSSQLMPSAKSALQCFQPVNCMCSNGYVYISMGMEIILMYSIEGDIWTSLDFPPVIEEEAVHIQTPNTLGIWEGRTFITRENCGERNVTVWELVDRTKQEWVEYDCLGKYPWEYDCLTECTFRGHGTYDNMLLVPCFCNGYLLLYIWQYDTCQSEGLMMFNLATKEWRKVGLPQWTVAIEELENENEFEGSDDEDEHD